MEGMCFPHQRTEEKREGTANTIFMGMYSKSSGVGGARLGSQKSGTCSLDAAGGYEPASHREQVTSLAHLAQVVVAASGFLL